MLDKTFQNTNERLTKSQENKQLSSTEIMAYCAPIAAAFFLFGPIQSVIPGIYAKYFGLELTAIAGVIFISRLFDAVTDPLIGFFSDRTAPRKNSRKLWVVAGCILLLLSTYFLFSPPKEVSFFYFLFWFLAFYLSMTIIDIPHVSWGALLAPDYRERNRLYAYRVAFVKIGMFAFYALPFLPLFETQEFTPETLRISVFLGIIFMGLMLGIFWRFSPMTPTMKRLEASPAESFSSVVNSIIKNKPLLIFIAPFLLGGIGTGMWLGLLFIYLDVYLQQAEKVAMFFMVGSLTGFMAVPLWQQLGKRLSKASVWGLNKIIFTFTVISYYWLVTPGMEPLIPMIITAVLYICFAGESILAPSVLADIVDYGIFKFKRDRSATYFSVWSLLNKASMGIGAALGLVIAGYFGFDPSATTHTEESVLGLKWAFSVLPGLCALTAFFLILRTPISPNRHQAIRRRIESRHMHKDNKQ